MKRQYILTGNPLAVTTFSRQHPQHIWDELRYQINHNKQELYNQHDDNPLLTKPLSIKVKFYIKPEKKSEKLDNQPHIKTNPSLDRLYNYLVKVLTNIVIAEQTPILSVTAQKFYASDPRTELIIIQE